MIYQTMEVHPKKVGEGRKAEGFTPTLTAYLPDNTPEIDVNRTRKTVLLCPGGGYCMTSDREAEPVALKLAAAGYNVFILRYSVQPATFPTALVELATAMSMLRDHAKEWHIQADKIVVGGFSAGGHLAASLGVFWDSDYLEEQTGLPRSSYQPNGLLLNYPVITSGEFAHRGSFEALLADRYTEEMLSLTSLEQQVTKSTPSSFVWHTYTDDAVPVENTLLWAGAMKKCENPLELHIFPSGVHGLSLANTLSAREDQPHMLEPDCEIWFDLFLTWLKKF